MDAALLGGVACRTAECAALLLLGAQLRAARLLSATDAEAARRLVGYLLLPAVVLHSCNTLPAVPWQALLGAPVVLAASAASAGVAWVCFRGRHKRERAVLAGCSLGADAPCVAVPLAEALAGPAGVVAACSAVLANALAVCVGSYLLTASAGPAFPASYAHDDGGSYRGEWRGMYKEGVGVYTYPSGARYEGEWRDNVKAGRGVYYFPKGGTYEGEWAGGVMSGTGLRTYASGRVAAGRWEDGRLAAPLELWQCATAAEGAAEAALASRRVVVGGGGPADALQLLALQPVVWAVLAGLALNALQVPLPASLAAVAGALAPANRALSLLTAGLLLQPALPQPRQVRDVLCVLASRVACALVCTATALALLQLAPGGSAPGSSAAACGLLSLAAAGLVLLGPLPPAVLEFTRNFRLNEALTGACLNASLLVAGPLLLLFLGALAALQLLPGLDAPPGTLPQLSAAAAAGWQQSATLLAAVMVVLAAGVAVGAGVAWERLSPSRGRTLRYAGPPAAAAGAGAAAAASQPGAGSAGVGLGDSGGSGGKGDSSAAAAVGQAGRGSRRWRSRQLPQLQRRQLPSVPLVPRPASCRRAGAPVCRAAVRLPG